eukprot:365661-Chlamydomonas_euryale.AAC.3
MIRTGCRRRAAAVSSAADAPLRARHASRPMSGRWRAHGHHGHRDVGARPWHSTLTWGPCGLQSPACRVPAASSMRGVPLAV